MGAAEGDAAEERPCLEVLLGLPARGISRRSEGHLIQSLEVRRGVIGWYCGGRWGVGGVG